jgi:hypothetical protein
VATRSGIVRKDVATSRCRDGFDLGDSGIVAGLGGYGVGSLRSCMGGGRRQGHRLHNHESNERGTLIFTSTSEINASDLVTNLADG